MQPLVIYFNEQCVKDIPLDFHWETGTQNLCKVIDAFFNIRVDGFVGFPCHQWQSNCGGIHFYELLKRAYSNKDRYLQLLRKIKKIPDADLQLMTEIHWNGKSALGLSMASAIQSWAISLFLINTEWTKADIDVQGYTLDEENKDLVGPTSTTIKHLSDTQHAIDWATEIRDWGAVPAVSCVLDKIQGHSIVMYPGPMEHNPPHVHLLEKQSGKTLAKYRIDIFERPKGPPTWDADMKAWVDKYQEQLLKSWQRCQEGYLPFKLE